MFDLFVREKRVFANVLQELVEGENYNLGEPWQFASESLSAVVPILQNVVENRQYLVAQEVSPEKVSVIDFGQIGKLRLEIDNVDKPVFVRAGTIFKGQGTQSRALGMGICVDPEKESVVNVFCVHASHGISTGSRFSMQSDIVPRKVEEVLTSPVKNQSQIWAAAVVRQSRPQINACPECHSTRLMQDYEAELVCMNCGYVLAAKIADRGPDRSANPLRSPINRFGDNLVNNLEEMNDFNRRVDDMISRIPADLTNQVGIAMIDSKGVYGLEMFNHPDSWRAFSKSIVRNYADVLAKERVGDGLFALKVERIPNAIKEFLREAEGLTENSVFKNKICETYTLSGKLIGEYSTLKHDVIHLILKRKNQPATR
jgi:hypothetical protein